MVYIQRRGDGYLETVDAFATWGEASATIREYRISDSSGYYYLSSRACGNWVDAS